MRYRQHYMTARSCLEQQASPQSLVVTANPASLANCTCNPWLCHSLPLQLRGIQESEERVAGSSLNLSVCSYSVSKWHPQHHIEVWLSAVCLQVISLPLLQHLPHSWMPLRDSFSPLPFIELPCFNLSTNLRSIFDSILNPLCNEEFSNYR